MPNFIPHASPHSHIVHTRQEFKKERSESSINIQIIAECNFEYWQINWQLILIQLMDSSVRYIHHRKPPLFDSKEEPCAEGWRLERKQDVVQLSNEWRVH